MATDGKCDPLISQVTSAKHSCPGVAHTHYIQLRLDHRSRLGLLEGMLKRQRGLREVLVAVAQGVEGAEGEEGEAGGDRGKLECGGHCVCLVVGVAWVRQSGCAELRFADERVDVD